MPDKLDVAVLFGGRSAEHAVSLVSAEAVMGAMDRDKYNVIPVGITVEGRWLAGGDPLQALRSGSIPGDCYAAAMLTDPLNPGIILLDWKGQGRSVGFIPLQAVFPVLHGPFGEDGCIQGLLELAGLPYVGAGVLSSAAAMDKVMMKMLFRQNGLPVGDFITFTAEQWYDQENDLCNTVAGKLDYPCFIKPANMGSSIGVSKAADGEELRSAVAEALRYDRKVLVEAFIPGREVECSVLGDAEAVASPLGEIVPSNDFYDYSAKYQDQRSRLLIPAPLPQPTQLRLQEYAVQAFHAVECSGMGRVDFFYQEATDQIIVNEINTIPGFTSISMYPKLWETGGISFSSLVDRLIKIALKRAKQ